MFTMYPTSTGLYESLNAAREALANEQGGTSCEMRIMREPNGYAVAAYRLDGSFIGYANADPVRR